MFRSYLSTKEHLYTPVSAQKDADELLLRNTETKSTRRRAFLQAFFLLEALQLFIFFAVYATHTHNISKNIHPEHELDSYYNLFEYNQVKNFYGEAALMNRTAESDALFEQIQNTDGVVAIDTEWALRHGFEPSVPHPDDPSKGIYQLDVFHSMHCIYRLRMKLTSTLSLSEWPRDDDHTLHCLDYMREQLHCNADLTLEATDDLVHFNKNSGHVCRNSDSIMDWAVKYHWDSHRQFVHKTLGLE